MLIALASGKYTNNINSLYLISFLLILITPICSTRFLLYFVLSAILVWIGRMLYDFNNDLSVVRRMTTLHLVYSLLSQSILLSNLGKTLYDVNYKIINFGSKNSKYITNTAVINTIWPEKLLSSLENSYFAFINEKKVHSKRNIQN